MDLQRLIQAPAEIRFSLAIHDRFSFPTALPPQRFLQRRIPSLVPSLQPAAGNPVDIGGAPDFVMAYDTGTELQVHWPLLAKSSLAGESLEHFLQFPRQLRRHHSIARRRRNYIR